MHIRLLSILCLSGMIGFWSGCGTRVQESDDVQAVTAEAFAKEVLQAREPVVVDFWAPWCVPCRIIAPRLDALAREYGTRVKFRKVNIDQAPNIATRYKIEAIPAVYLFRDGKPLDFIVGVRSKKAYQEWIEQFL